MPTDTLTITSGSPATQIVSAGDGPTLIANQGPNTVWVGDTNTVQWTDGSGIVPLTPNSSYAVNGAQDVYATVAPGLPSTIATIAGGLNFFQPVSSITIPTGATSGARIVLNGLTGVIEAYGTNGRISYVITPTGIFMYI